MCDINWFLPKIVWSIMHDGVIVIIEVSSGVIIILKVEVAMLSFSDILVNDLDVLVPV